MSNADLAHQIEGYLREKACWVSTVELCQVFGVKERAFRSIDTSPGLCTAFAISGDKGFKHVELATTMEWLRFKGRMVWHAVGELRRVRALSKRRQLARARTAAPMEQDTRQMLFPITEEVSSHGPN